MEIIRTTAILLTSAAAALCPAGLPAGVNLDVQVYADGICGPGTISFGADGALYVGNNGSGCGVGPGDAVPVRRIAPGGGAFTDFGPPIPDPDTVAVDAEGSVSGTPGSVLVGHIGASGGWLVAILPSGSVNTVFANDTALANPSEMAFDSTGRLLVSDAFGEGIHVIQGGAPVLLIAPNPAPLGAFAPGPGGAVYVADSVGGFDIYDAGGQLVEPDVAAVAGQLGQIVYAGEGPFAGRVLAVREDDLLAIDPQTGVAEVIGMGFAGTPDVAIGPDGALYLPLGQAVYRVALACAADLAEPFGLLDLNDTLAFVQGFVAMDPVADFDGNGLFDLDDVLAFVQAFLAGCP
jgi:hypothetical protein